MRVTLRGASVFVIASSLVVVEALMVLHVGLSRVDFFRAEGDSIWDWNPHDGLTVRSPASARVVRPWSYSIDIDSRGARVGAQGVETPTEVDVMTLGCSVAFGWGVEQRDTFSSVLARALDLRAANLAIPATGTVSALRALERNRDLAPRVIVYGLIGDHLRRNEAHCALVPALGCVSLPHVEWEAGEPRIVPPGGTADAFHEAARLGSIIAENRLTDAPWIALQLLRSLAWFAGHRDVFASPPPERGGATLKFLLDRMHAEARALGAALVIAYIPPDDNAGVPAKEILRALPRDAVFVDMAPEYRSLRSRSGVTLELPGDKHPNATAHALIARRLESAVHELLVHPRGARPS